MAPTRRMTSHIPVVADVRGFRKLRGVVLAKDVSVAIDASDIEGPYSEVEFDDGSHAPHESKNSHFRVFRKPTNRRTRIISHSSRARSMAYDLSLRLAR